MAGLALHSLVLALPPLLAGGVRLSPQSRGSTELLDVSGMHGLSQEEVNGTQPLFVDAFLNPARTEAYIILNMKLFNNVKRSMYEAMALAKWSCRWKVNGAATSIAREAGEEHQELEGSSSAAAKHSLENKHTTHTGDGDQHTLIVTCPAPDAHSGVVTLSAIGNNKELIFQRDNIVLNTRSFFKQAQAALCTMMIKQTAATTLLLRQWIQYHLNLGFDQILIYIEDEDPSWAPELLQKFLASGRVQLVHFWFGNVSKSRTFQMQQSQEHHCLYKAKGRVAWIAHADADEFFQIMDGAPDIKALLSRVVDTGVNNYAAVSVRSQFWGFPDRATTNFTTRLARRTMNETWENQPKHLPCEATCKDPGYFDRDVRSKVIVRPSEVFYFSVHHLSTFWGNPFYANPWSELRLNHFKGMGWKLFPNCKEDLSFKSVCERLAKPGLAPEIVLAREPRPVPPAAEKRPRHEKRRPLGFRWLRAMKAAGADPPTAQLRAG